MRGPQMPEFNKTAYGRRNLPTCYASEISDNTNDENQPDSTIDRPHSRKLFHAGSDRLRLEHSSRTVFLSSRRADLRLDHVSA